MAKEEIFELPNEVVTVKYIKRKKGMASNVDDSHVISGGMLNNSKRKFCAPLNSRSGKIMNVLTNKEKEYLESKLGIDLSVYKDFWDTFYVTLHKDDTSNKFDLSDPMQYLSVRLLAALKDTIAPSWKDRNKKTTYEFVITHDNEEFKEKKAAFDSKKEAFKLYGKIEDDLDKLIIILKLLSNKPISKDAKLNWVQGKVEEYIDSMPSAFLSVASDSSFSTKALIHKGLDNGYIVRDGNKYSTVDGLDLKNKAEAPSFDNAVRYLEDPKNQDIRDLIEAKIDKSKK